jgi:hypothetical protein
LEEVYDLVGRGGHHQAIIVATKLGTEAMKSTIVEPVSLLLLIFGRVESRKG